MRETKHELIKAGADLFLRRSYQGTGINDILGATRIPKGSFYHFFAGKEDFGLAVIDYQAEAVRARWAALLEDASLSPLRRIQTLFDRGAERLAASDFAGGCPLGTMAQEMSGLSERLRQAVNTALQTVEGQLAACVREGQESGDITKDVEAAAAAQLVWYAWQGGLIAAKAARSTVPLEDLKRIVTEYFLPDA